MRHARKYLRELERNWWNETIRECENACSQRRLGDMYMYFRKIVTRDEPATLSMNTTVNEFRDPFERLSHER